jgi:hypothetical protein
MRPHEDVLRISGISGFDLTMLVVRMLVQDFGAQVEGVDGDDSTVTVRMRLEEPLELTLRMAEPQETEAGQPI